LKEKINELEKDSIKNKHRDSSKIYTVFSHLQKTTEEFKETRMDHFCRVVQEERSISARVLNEVSGLLAGVCSGVAEVSQQHVGKVHAMQDVQPVEKLIVHSPHNNLEDTNIKSNLQQVTRGVGLKSPEFVASVTSSSGDSNNASVEHQHYLRLSQDSQVAIPCKNEKKCTQSQNDSYPESENPVDKSLTSEGLGESILNMKEEIQFLGVKERNRVSFAPEDSVHTVSMVEVEDSDSTLPMGEVNELELTSDGD
jgi:hypothetical protein